MSRFAERLSGQVIAGSGLVLAEWTAEGATGQTPLYQAPLHRHEEDEAWYVLDGVLMVRSGAEDVEVHPGGAVVVPGGTAHTFWNPSPAPTRYLIVMGSRTYALIQAIHAAEDRGADAMRALFVAYGAELLEVP